MRQTVSQRGFTLVELATVMVIVGLILGLAFKGRDLIDGARVKSAQASASKVLAAMHIYFERYGRYPGDGCSGNVPPEQVTPADCGGIADNRYTAAEAAAFVPLLIRTGMLSAADARTPFGGNWSAAPGSGADNTEAHALYLTVGGVDSHSVDLRYVCALDAQYDDGDPAGGQLRSNVSPGGDAGRYQRGDDCWSAKQGMQALNVRLLP
ncbi:type II secretion system protein [Chitiniphilus shinanonensis]|uniref:type II secretion system protein n=1 Tax=Chitiniphilus shinanonensis TaxID=553088 RepID=UPI00305952DF